MRSRDALVVPKNVGYVYFFFLRFVLCCCWSRSVRCVGVSEVDDAIIVIVNMSRWCCCWWWRLKKKVGDHVKFGSQLIMDSLCMSR